MPYVVAIKHISELAPGGQRVFDSVRQRRFAGATQAGEPDDAALVVQGRE